MSVENHRHCQATVLGATGDEPESGLTWNDISSLDLRNLPSNWLECFRSNKNVTGDLAGILTLLDWLAGLVAQQSAGQSQSLPLPGDLIDVNGRTVKVRNDIPTSYKGLVGITNGSGATRKLTAQPFSVANTYEDGPVIATITIGNQPPIVIRGAPNQTPVPTERYLVSEDAEYDIVLSGTDDGVPVKYWEGETQPSIERCVVTENGHQYDIGVSGYGADVLLNYNDPT